MSQPQVTSRRGGFSKRIQSSQALFGHHEALIGPPPPGARKQPVFNAGDLPGVTGEQRFIIERKVEKALTDIDVQIEDDLELDDAIQPGLSSRLLAKNVELAEEERDALCFRKNRRREHRQQAEGESLTSIRRRSRSQSRRRTVNGVSSLKSTAKTLERQIHDLQDLLDLSNAEQEAEARDLEKLEAAKQDWEEQMAEERAEVAHWRRQVQEETELRQEAVERLIHEEDLKHEAEQIAARTETDAEVERNHLQQQIDEIRSEKLEAEKEAALALSSHMEAAQQQREEAEAELAAARESREAAWDHAEALLGRDAVEELIDLRTSEEQALQEAAAEHEVCIGELLAAERAQEQLEKIQHRLSQEEDLSAELRRLSDEQTDKAGEQAGRAAAEARSAALAEEQAAKEATVAEEALRQAGSALEEMEQSQQEAAKSNKEAAKSERKAALSAEEAQEESQRSAGLRQQADEALREARSAFEELEQARQEAAKSSKEAAKSERKAAQCAEEAQAERQHAEKATGEVREEARALEAAQEDEVRVQQVVSQEESVASAAKQEEAECKGAMAKAEETARTEVAAREEALRAETAAQMERRVFMEEAQAAEQRASESELGQKNQQLEMKNGQLTQKLEERGQELDEQHRVNRQLRQKLRRVREVVLTETAGTDSENSVPAEADHMQVPSSDSLSLTSAASWNIVSGSAAGAAAEEVPKGPRSQHSLPEDASVLAHNGREIDVGKLEIGEALMSVAGVTEGDIEFNKKVVVREIRPGFTSSYIQCKLLESQAPDPGRPRGTAFKLCESGFVLAKRTGSNVWHPTENTELIDAESYDDSTETVAGFKLMSFDNRARSSEYEEIPVLEAKLTNIQNEHILTVEISVENDEDTDGVIFARIGNSPFLAVRGESQLDKKVAVLEFARNPKALHKALNEEPTLRACRTALKEEGYQTEVNEARLYVVPSIAGKVLKCLEDEGIKTRSHNVIVSRRFQPHVFKAAKSVRANERVRLRPGALQVPWQAREAADAYHANTDSALLIDNHGRPLLLSRTFLDLAPEATSDGKTYTVSTSQAHIAAPNVRRKGPARGV